MRPSRARHPAAGCGSVLLLVMTTGCGVDLLVGGAGGSTGAGSETGGEAGEATVAMPATDDAADSSSGTTTAEGTTTSAEESTSTGPPEESTSTGTEETTTGELPCEGQNIEVCNELSYCLWYPDSEDCLPNPCMMEPPHECFEQEFKLCVDAPACAWVGEPEMGECAPLECVPCEGLELGQCMESPFCVWEEMKMFCDVLPM